MLYAPHLVVLTIMACALAVKHQSASRISLGNIRARCETPIAAYDERARHNGQHHKMWRIGLAESVVDLKR